VTAAAPPAAEDDQSDSGSEEWDPLPVPPKSHVPLHTQIINSRCHQAQAPWMETLFESEQDKEAHQAADLVSRLEFQLACKVNAVEVRPYCTADSCAPLQPLSASVVRADGSVISAHTLIPYNTSASSVFPFAFPAIPVQPPSAAVRPASPVPFSRTVRAPPPGGLTAPVTPIISSVGADQNRHTRAVAIIIAAADDNRVHDAAPKPVAAGTGSSRGTNGSRGTAAAVSAAKPQKKRQQVSNKTWLKLIKALGISTTSPPSAAAAAGKPVVGLSDKSRGSSGEQSDDTGGGAAKRRCLRFPGSAIRALFERRRQMAGSKGVGGRGRGTVVEAAVKQPLEQVAAEEEVDSSSDTGPGSVGTASAAVAPAVAPAAALAIQAVAAPGAAAQQPRIASEKEKGVRDKAVNGKTVAGMKEVVKKSFKEKVEEAKVKVRGEWEDLCVKARMAVCIKPAAVELSVS